MSVGQKIALCATAAVIGFTSAQGASAQSDQQTAASAGGGLEEIVVTARRKEERAQSVPISITAFSQKDIEAKRILQASDLGRIVPSLAVEQVSSDPNTPYGINLLLRGLHGTVIYFADVPVGSVDFNAASGTTHGSSAGFYYDLDNVEVLKGPQGTLFGKNSIGGLISIEPKQPTNNFEGYAQVEFGNYNDRKFDAAVNIPIVDDKVLLRIAGQSQQRDGYTTDISTGRDLDDRNYYAWRVGLTVRPTDSLENYLVYDGYWQDTNGPAFIPLYTNPKVTFAQIPVPGIGNVPLTLGKGPGLAALENPATAAATYASLLKTFLSGGKPSLSFFPNDLAVFAQQRALGAREVGGQSTASIGKDYLYGITNKTTWDINDDLTVKNIAAARIFKQLSGYSYTNILPILAVGDPVNNTGWNDNSAQYTEELQLQGKSFDEKLSWVVGAFLEFDHPIGTNNKPGVAVGNYTFPAYNETNLSRAIFAQATYDLDDHISGLKLTGGYRYTWDYQSLGEVETAGVPYVTRDPVTGRGNNCTLSGFDKNCTVGSSGHFSSFGWNLDLEEQLTPTTLLYVRSGNAYRPGGTNPNVPPPFQNYQPEHVTDVEIGAKSDWDLLGAHFRTNGDVFHTTYKSIQVQDAVGIKNELGQTVPVILEANAATATLEGGELEVTAVPLEGLEISPHASYLWAHYTQYPPLIVGKELPQFYYAPKWQFGVTGTYHLPMDQSYGDIAVSASYSFQSHEYGVPNGSGEILGILPSYDNLDFRIDWTNFLSNPVDLGFFMTNATDNLHIVGVTPIYVQLGFTSVTYNAPRMFGFSAKYRFGGPNTTEEPTAAYTPPPAVPVAPATPKSYLVFFDFNKSDLTSQAVSIVGQAAANAGPAKVTKLEVTGHTDTVGSDGYNMRLSRRRAESVAAQLEKDGIPANEIAIYAKGKHDLLVPTNDGVREPQNRRVQIVYSDGAGS